MSSHESESERLRPEDITVHVDAYPSHGLYVFPTQKKDEQLLQPTHYKVSEYPRTEVIEQLEQHGYSHAYCDVEHIDGIDVLEYAPSEYSQYEKDLGRLQQVGTTKDLNESFKVVHKDLLFAFFICF